MTLTLQLVQRGTEISFVEGEGKNRWRRTTLPYCCRNRLTNWRGYNSFLYLDKIQHLLQKFLVLLNISRWYASSSCVHRMSHELSEHPTSQSMLTSKIITSRLTSHPITGGVGTLRSPTCCDDCWGYETGPCTALAWVKGLDTLEQVWNSGGVHSWSH